MLFRSHRGRRRLFARRSESRAAPVPAWGEEDAHLRPQSVCGPRLCADSGSRGCPCCARAAGARPVVPASCLSGKCRKRALNSSTSRPPPPLPGSPPQTSQPPACRTRPPLTLTRARTAPLARSHSSRLALGAAQAPGVRNYWTNCRRDCRRRPEARRDSPLVPAPRTLARAAAAGDLGEQGLPPASRQGGARAPGG